MIWLYWHTSCLDSLLSKSSRLSCGKTPENFYSDKWQNYVCTCQRVTERTVQVLVSVVPMEVCVCVWSWHFSIVWWGLQRIAEVIVRTHNRVCPVLVKSSVIPKLKSCTIACITQLTIRTRDPETSGAQHSIAQHLEQHVVSLSLVTLSSLAELNSLVNLSWTQLSGLCEPP